MENNEKAIKTIEDYKKYVESDIKEKNAQYQATISYHSEIKSITSQVTLEITNKKISRIPSYHIDSERIDLEPIVGEYRYAELKVMGYTIDIRRHHVYNFSRTKSDNFEMTIPILPYNRYYKKASTVVSKIVEIKTEEEAKKQRATAIETAKEDAYKDIIQQYSDIKAEFTSSYPRDTLRLTVNGTVLEYQIYVNTPTNINPKTYTLSLHTVKPSVKTVDYLIKAFSNTNNI